MQQSRENKRKEVEYEKLEKQSLAFQYELLKEQINPHFLFNCFSILNSLVNQDAKKASTFVHHLSDIYRYVLSHNANTLVKVSEELVFLDSYTSILHFRFTEGLKILIDIKPTDVSRQIIPMSLQLLIENAVKHNKISLEEPLVIEINSDGRNLSVVNNINKKTVRGTTSIGLDNLRNRYSLLNSSSVEVSRKYKTRILTRFADQVLSIDMEELAYFFAEDRICCLMTKAGKTYFIDYTLDTLEKVLDPSVFFRLSRNCIASITSIKQVSKHFNSRLKVRLQPDFPKEELFVSRAKVTDFMKWMDGEV